MRKINVSAIMCVFMLLVGFKGKAQNLFTEIKSRVIPMTLDISNKKTSNLIFPYAVKSVDRGSKDVLVQKARGVENILQVKAANDTLKETNLSVITADGSLYSFMLRYVLNPQLLNLSLGQMVTTPSVALFNPDGNNEGKTFDLAEQLLYRKAFDNGRVARYDNISIRNTGIYVKDDIFYLQFTLKNSSSINYSIDQLRFLIRDQKKSKRTASQELQLQPSNIAGKFSSIGPSSEQTIVVCLPKFTIPDQKNFIIQMTEKNGGRNLDLRLKDKQLMRAITL